MKNMKKIFCSLFVFLMIFVVTTKVEAKTLGEFKKELADMKEKYEKNQAQKKLTEEQIQQVKNDITSIVSQIDQINQDIVNLNNDIEKRNEDIKKMREELKSIMHYYQINSTESFYLEYVFNASDYTEFIYRLALTEQLSQYREKKINEFNKLIEENKKQIAEISAKKTELKKLESELSDKRKKLENDLAGITTAGISIKDDIADLEGTVKKYQNTYKCSDNEQISTCVNRYNNSNNNGGGGKKYAPVISSSGFHFPLPYYDRISAEFLHHDRAMDIAVADGTPVYSIADGTVSYIKRKSSCGGNMLYIVHLVNGTKYTSAYFHLKSIIVDEGQGIKKGQLVGYSGGVKKGVSYNNYDGCTTGPHLHLQTAYGYYDPYSMFSGGYISWSKFNSKSFNPRNIINF